jgi:aldehyde:ferredoxin oxidoreductase
LEYETIVLMGANGMIDGTDIITRMSAACNDVGVDTMDVGSDITVAKEA